VIYRRTRQEMPAHEFEVNEALHEGIQFIYLAAPERVQKAGGALRLRLQRMQLGEPDASGRRRPVPLPGNTFDMDADTVLVAIGQSPDTISLGLRLRRDGTLEVEPATMHTSRRGVFAAGDIVTGPVSVIEAIGGGRRAAQAIDKYLGGDGHIDEVLAPPCGEEMRMPTDLLAAGEKRTPMPEVDASKRARSFDECMLGLSEEQARREARRCIRCDLWRSQGVPGVWPKGKKLED